MEGVLDSLFEGCWLLGLDLRYRYLNEAAVRHARRPRDELLGHQVTEAYPGVESTDIFAALEHCARERIPQTLETEFLYPDEERRWFEIRLSPVPEGVFILSIDITEKKAAEAGVAHLRAVVRAVRSINQLITRERDPERLVKTACEILVESRGFSSAAIAVVRGGSAPFGTVAGATAAIEPLTRVLASGELPPCLREVIEGTEAVTRPAHPSADLAAFCDPCCIQQEECWRDAIAIRLECDSVTFGALLVMLTGDTFATPEEVDLLREAARDVAFALRSMKLRAERDAAVQEVVDTGQQLEAIVQASPAAVISLDTEARVITWNPAAERIFGWCQHEVVGKQLPTIPSRSREEHVALWKRVKGGESFCGVEVERLRRDGTSCTVSLSCAPLYGADGRVIGGMIVALDVTEARHTEEQLRVSQRLEAVGRLAAGIAHDFNNLLAIILVCTDFALDATGEHDADVREDLHKIRSSAERAGVLTRQLLAFGRRQVLRPEVVGLNEVLSSMHGMLSRAIGEDIELTLRLAPDLGNIKADVGQIEQVVLNLVVNARDAMPRGGALTLETVNIGEDELPAELLEERRSGEHVMLSVTDTGSGMTSEIKARIFEPFFTTKEVGRGTGLGLSTVYGIVAQSGGHIVVDSEPGCGAVFKVYFPRESTEIRASRTAPAAKSRSGGHQSILVVEDDHDVRSVAERILSAAGYRVLSASDADEAIARAGGAAEPIDLLLSDVVLPRASGPELFSRLAASRPHLKVLFTSGYAESTTASHGVLDPEVPFIPKPFSAVDLLSKVREALGDTVGDDVIAEPHGASSASVVGR